MAVDSVNNTSNNAGMYALGAGAATGIGAGAYGYYSKSYLKDGEIKDSFIRKIENQILEADKDIAPDEKQMYKDSLKFYDDIRPVHKHIFDIANFDILFMLKAYDKIGDKESVRCRSLLKASMELCDWLLNHNNAPAKDVIYHLNRLQISKRERPLSIEELQYLDKIICSEDIAPNIKVGACLLAEAKDEFRSFYDKCTDQEKQEIESFPIWHFRELIN